MIFIKTQEGLYQNKVIYRWFLPATVKWVIIANNVSQGKKYK